MAEIIQAYLRAGENEGEDAVAFFTFEGADVALLVNEQLNVEVRAVRKDGAIGKTVHGRGGIEVVAVEDGDDKSPSIRGHFVTAKGSHFVLAGWHHEDPHRGDEYVSLRITPRVIRKGFLPQRKQAAAA